MLELRRELWYYAFVVGGTEVGKYLLLSVLIGLYAKVKRSRVLDDKTRGRIVGYIGTNPGTHYNKIKKDLELTNGKLAHHLQVLVKAGYLKYDNDGIYKRFYPHGYQRPEYNLTKTQAAIGGLLRRKGKMTQSQLAAKLKVSQPAVSRHIRKMMKAGVVRQSNGGYVLTEEFIASTRKTVEMEVKNGPKKDKEFYDPVSDGFILSRDEYEKLMDDKV